MEMTGGTGGSLGAEILCLKTGTNKVQIYEKARMRFQTSSQLSTILMKIIISVMTEIYEHAFVHTR